MEPTPSPNPNNCATCRHKPDPDGTGYCYMWVREPHDICGFHSRRRRSEREAAQSLSRLVRVVDELGARVCVAPEFVVAWADAHPAAIAVEGAGSRSSIMLPIVLATVLATAGCGSFAPQEPEATAAPIPLYNADGTPPPERMEQFYNPRTRTMVYRFCVGAACPAPTPKRPATPKLPVVTESSLDGGTLPADALTAAANGLPTVAAGPVLKTPPKPAPLPVKDNATPAAGGGSTAQRLGAAIASQRQAATRNITPAAAQGSDLPGAPGKKPVAPAAPTTVTAPEDAGGQLPTKGPKQAEPPKPQALQESTGGRLRG